LSWTGGNGLTAIDCQFNHTGRGALSSSPAAGIDIEAEDGVVRNGLFINCEVINNVGPGMGADSGDSADITFQRCTFIGSTKEALNKSTSDQRRANPPTPIRQWGFGE
jgi:hypothetical protein